MLHRVERAAFCRQQGAGIAGQSHEVGPGRNLLPLAHQHGDFHGGIELAEKSGGNRQARDHDRIAAVHHAGKARLRRDHAFRGNIAPAAGQAEAEVFRQGGSDKAIEIETGE